MHAFSHANGARGLFHAFQVAAPYVFLGYKPGFCAALGMKAQGNLKTPRPWLDYGWKQTTQGFAGVVAWHSAITSIFCIGEGAQVTLAKDERKKISYFS